MIVVAVVIDLIVALGPLSRRNNEPRREMEKKDEAKDKTLSVDERKKRNGERMFVSGDGQRLGRGEREKGNKVSCRL